jgi:hypothetical protein
MKTKPKKIEYFTFLEDREFKESEWMGKRKPKDQLPKEEFNKAMEEMEC